jgi:hypothetical protein
MTRTACALQFDLMSTETRCVYDVLKKDTLATGTFSVLPAETDTNVHISTTDPDGDEISSVRNAVSGKFAFVTHMAGEYQTCFRNKDMVVHTVTIQLRSGVEAKDL